MWTLYTPLYEEITGSINSIVVTELHTNAPYELPINVLILDLKKKASEDNDFGIIKNI